MIAPVVAELAEHTSTTAACALLGWSRATHYRAAASASCRAGGGRRPAPPNALTAGGV